MRTVNKQTHFSLPEALIEGVFVLVAPVLQVNAEAVVSLSAEVVGVIVAQPEVCVQVTETLLVVPPESVEGDRTVHTSLDHSPAAT